LTAVHRDDHRREGGATNTINAAEAAGGIVITGTAEAGSTVLVNGVTPLWLRTHLHGHPPAPTADGPLAVTVTSTDGGWNQARIRAPSRWNRGTTVTITGVEGGGLTAADTTINAAEARDGIVITGRAETGSTVTVNGVAAIVAADGTYTATIPAASLPATDGPLTVNVATTDAAGQHRDRDPDPDP
jgi:hypothetical protein